MIFKLKTFQSLSTEELYDIIRLRNEVFVLEQKCPYQDADGKDIEALHLMGTKGGELVAYARLLKPGISYKEASIGRVVVSRNHRGNKHGYELMDQALRASQMEFNANEVIVSAQKYLEKFYNDLGFVTESETYLEDDIPHIKMRYIKGE